MATDAEENVVGACLLGGSAIVERAHEIVERDYFYRQSLGAMFAACVAVVESGAEPDPVTVADELRRRGDLEDAGGIARLVELVALTPNVSNVERYARIVRATHRAREQFNVGRLLAKYASNGGLEEHPDLAIRIQQMVARSWGDGEAMDVIDLDELLAGPVPIVPWTWNKWIGLHDLTLCVGDPGVGKSYLLLALAMAIRCGAPFLGEPTARGRAGIIDVENPRSEIHARLYSLGLRSGDTDGIVYAHMPDLTLSTTAGLAAVDKMVETHDLDYLVLDSFRRLAPGIDENDSGAISAIMTPLRTITQARGVTIVVIHHAKKRGETPLEASQAARGSGDFGASVDTQLFLRQKTGEANTFTIEHAKNRHGYEHSSIVCRITQGEDGTTSIVNEGELATTEDVVEQILDRIISALADSDVPVSRRSVAKMANVRATQRLNRALALGVQRELIVERKRPGRGSEFVLPDRDLTLDSEASTEDDEGFPF